MRLIGLNHVEEFKLKQPGSRNALDRWARLIRENDFKSIAELKRIFPSADYAGTKMVFNVGGNKIRCITVIEYGVKMVVVTHVLTHKEYDRGKWKV